MARGRRRRLCRFDLRSKGSEPPSEGCPSPGESRRRSTCGAGPGAARQRHAANRALAACRRRLAQPAKSLGRARHAGVGRLACGGTCTGVAGIGGLAQSRPRLNPAAATAGSRGNASRLARRLHFAPWKAANVAAFPSARVGGRQRLAGETRGAHARQCPPSTSHCRLPATLAMPALAQTSSFSPPGAPETPTPPITSLPTLIGTPPPTATTLGICRR